MNPEAKIESAVVRYAVRKLGAIAIKLTGEVNTGMPDRLFLMPNGNKVFMEFKALGGKVSKKQRWMFERMHNMRHQVYVVNNVDDGIIAVDLAARTGEIFW